MLFVTVHASAAMLVLLEVPRILAEGGDACDALVSAAWQLDRGTPSPAWVLGELWPDTDAVPLSYKPAFGSGLAKQLVLARKMQWVSEHTLASAEVSGMQCLAADQTTLVALIIVQDSTGQGWVPKACMEALMGLGSSGIDRKLEAAVGVKAGNWRLDPGARLRKQSRHVSVGDFVFMRWASIEEKLTYGAPANIYGIFTCRIYVEFVCVCVFYIYIGRSRYMWSCRFFKAVGSAICPGNRLRFIKLEVALAIISSVGNTAHRTWPVAWMEAQRNYCGLARATVQLGLTQLPQRYRGEEADRLRHVMLTWAATLGQLPCWFDDFVMFRSANSKPGLRDITDQNGTSCGLWGLPGHSDLKKDLQLTNAQAVRYLMLSAASRVKYTVSPADSRVHMASFALLRGGAGVWLNFSVRWSEATAAQVAQGKTVSHPLSPLTPSCLPSHSVPQLTQLRHRSAEEHATGWLAGGRGLRASGHLGLLRRDACGGGSGGSSSSSGSTSSSGCGSGSDPPQLGECG
eukprot:COSAG03_NODE_289_length_9347_cov_501.073814_9_plen_516_part_00